MGFSVYYYRTQFAPLSTGQTVTLPYAAGQDRFSFLPTNNGHYAIGPFEQLLIEPAAFTVAFTVAGVEVTWNSTTIPIGREIVFQLVETPHPKIDGREVALADLSNAAITNFAKGLLNANGTPDLIALGLAPVASPILSGTPTAPTAAPGDNTTQISTTAFVDAVRSNLQASIDLKAPLANPTFTGIATVGQFRLTVLTAPQITADQNDYAPAGVSAVSLLRVSSDAARAITGLGATGQGRFMILANVGTYPITLVDQSAGSTAANRLDLGGANRVLLPTQCIELVYDAGSSRWRCMTPPLQDLSAYVTAAQAIAFAVAL